MLNFYVVSASRDMVNGTDRSTTCRSKFRAPPLQTKMQKMKVLPKTWVSPNNRLKISDQKLQTQNSHVQARTPVPYSSPTFSRKYAPKAS